MLDFKISEKIDPKKSYLEIGSGNVPEARLPIDGDQDARTNAPVPQKNPTDILNSNATYKFTKTEIAYFNPNRMANSEKIFLRIDFAVNAAPDSSMPITLTKANQSYAGYISGLKTDNGISTGTFEIEIPEKYQGSYVLKLGAAQAGQTGVSEGSKAEIKLV